jgi:hypothetical protein
VLQVLARLQVLDRGIRAQHVGLGLVDPRPIILVVATPCCISEIGVSDPAGVWSALGFDTKRR